jgi:hypothetical protein
VNHVSSSFPSSVVESNGLETQFPKQCLLPL